MKKFVSLLLVVAMMVLLASCVNQTADKYCTHCGNGMGKDDSFCPECGTAVAGAVSPSSTTDTTESTTTTTATKPTTTTTTTTKNPTTTTTKKHTTTTTTAKHTTTTAATTTTTTTTTTTQPAATTTTAHNHTYSEYVCTGCGEIDKSHAYDWLIELVKREGTAYSIAIDFDIFGDESLFLSYYPSDDYLVILSRHLDEDGEFNFASLDLKTFYYGVSYKEKSRVATGFLDAENFTENSPLTDVRYTGPSDGKYSYIEYTRSTLVLFVTALEAIADQTPGMTIDDLGFSSWE